MTQSLVHLFGESAARRPDATAVVWRDRRVTYGRLWSDVCAVATFLRDREIEPEARVGILVENSPEYVAAYYGTLAAGGTAIGLNTAAKARDLVNWIKHGDITLLIASAKHRELNEVLSNLEDGIRLVTIGPLPPRLPKESVTAQWEDVMAGSRDEPDLEAAITSPDQLAAFIYTSGTTGNPKGVTLSHRNLMANTRSIQEYLALSETDSIVNVLPFFYSYGNSILHTHLAVGATIVLENSLVYPHKVLARLVEEKATGFSGVPSTFALLLSRTKLEEYELGALRYFTQAGGPMPPSNIERLKSAVPHVSIFIMYGQTEATARLTYLPPEKLEEKLGSCGIPIPGVEIEIQDKSGNRVAPNVTGEICARGENIMLGYWKDPDTTKQVIVDGWLKTGDLAHTDEDGFIFIDGRSSEMIKSGGQRISPKEIEEIITEIDGIQEVGVVGVDDDMLGQVVKAVIVTKPGIVLDEKKIRNYCLKNLAQYKIPKTIEFTATALPKTASGKLKRHLI